METKPELLLNASAIIFGFTIAFFHSWAYSSEEPYERKHLWFLFPLFMSEIFLAGTIVLVLIPSTVNYALWIGPYLIGVALFFLIGSKIISVVIEWKHSSEELI